MQQLYVKEQINKISVIRISWNFSRARLNVIVYCFERLFELSSLCKKKNAFYDSNEQRFREKLINKLFVSAKF